MTAGGGDGGSHRLPRRSKCGINSEAKLTSLLSRMAVFNVAETVSTSGRLSEVTPVVEQRRHR